MVELRPTPEGEMPFHLHSFRSIAGSMKKHCDNSRNAKNENDCPDNDIWKVLHHIPIGLTSLRGR